MICLGIVASSQQPVQSALPPRLIITSLLNSLHHSLSDRPSPQQNQNSIYTSCNKIRSLHRGHGSCYITYPHATFILHLVVDSEQSMDDATSNSELKEPTSKDQKQCRFGCLAAASQSGRSVLIVRRGDLSIPQPTV